MWVRFKDNFGVVSVVLFDQDVTRLLGKISNDMVKVFLEDGDENAFPDELNVVVD